MGWTLQDGARLDGAVRRDVGITWNWAEAGRGALRGLLAAVIMLAVDLVLGMAFAIATIPVAMLGVPPQRRRRLRLGLVGLAFAVSSRLGSVLGLWEVVAVAALTGLAYAGVLVSMPRPAPGCSRRCCCQPPPSG